MTIHYVPCEIRDHPPISEAELIKKRDIFDPLEDDDDIDWKHNPFDEVDVERIMLPVDVVIIFEGGATYVQDYL